MEARVAQVASEVRRLQEAERRMNNTSEGRSGSDADRMVQLQEHLNVLTQQRLQHLETIQGQQLELQVQCPLHFSTYIPFVSLLFISNEYIRVGFLLELSLGICSGCCNGTYHPTLTIHISYRLWCYPSTNYIHTRV